MATTANGIIYPVASDFVGPLNTHLQNIATSTQSAINNKTTYTPTLNNITLGNGSLVAYYSRSGGIIIDEVYITFGSTTTVGGTISIGALPVGTYVGGTAMPSGSVTFYDSSATTTYFGPAITTGTTIAPKIENVSGTYPTLADVNATVPFTWAVGDKLIIKTFRMTSN